jgi:thiol-disulfide isomerase/thioredoxin
MRISTTLGLIFMLSITACNSPKVSDKPSSITTLPRTSLPMPPVNSSSANNTKTSGGSAPAFTRLDNRRMRLSDYIGYVVVLDFYATWCQPCRVQTPHLVSLYQKYKPQGLRVVGLNVGGPDDRNNIPQFVEEFKIPYDLAYPNEEMTELYLSDDDRIPQTFVFDRKGQLVKRFISYDQSMPAELERSVESALNAQIE